MDKREQSAFSDRYEIYKSFENGQKEQAYEQAQAYGLHAFIQATREDCIEGIIPKNDVFACLRGIVLIASVRGNLS